MVTKFRFLCLLELTAHILACSPNGQFMHAHALCISLPVVGGCRPELFMFAAMHMLLTCVSLHLIRSSQLSGCQLMIMFKVLIAFFHPSPLLCLRLIFSFSYLFLCLCFNISIFLSLSPHPAHVKLATYISKNIYSCGSDKWLISRIYKKLQPNYIHKKSNLKCTKA